MGLLLLIYLQLRRLWFLDCFVCKSLTVKIFALNVQENCKVKVLYSYSQLLDKYLVKSLFSVNKHLNPHFFTYLSNHENCKKYIFPFSSNSSLNTLHLYVVIFFNDYKRNPQDIWSGNFFIVQGGSREWLWMVQCLHLEKKFYQVLLQNIQFLLY